MADLECGQAVEIVRIVCFASLNDSGDHQKIGEEEIIDYNLCYMFLLWMLLDDNQLFSLL